MIADHPFSLESKTIVITGASSGIGRQCAISCSRLGAKVVLIGRSEERLQETLALMYAPGKHYLMALDLTDYQKVAEDIDIYVAREDRINGLVNCAGVSTTLPLKLTGMEKVQEMFAANVFAAYNLTNEVCKMRHFAKEGGSIIFLSSVMGCVGENGKSLYSMTKGALLSGTRSLACELAKKRIRVNSISPGAIITPINRSLPHMADPDRRKILEEQHLLGLGETEDIANACIYLLSDAARWVTGINLVVDGGYTAR